MKGINHILKENEISSDIDSKSLVTNWPQERGLDPKR